MIGWARAQQLPPAVDNVQSDTLTNKHVSCISDTFPKGDSTQSACPQQAYIYTYGFRRDSLRYHCFEGRLSPECHRARPSGAHRVHPVVLLTVIQLQAECSSRCPPGDPKQLSSATACS